MPKPWVVLAIGLTIFFTANTVRFLYTGGVRTLFGMDHCHDDLLPGEVAPVKRVGKSPPENFGVGKPATPQ